MKWKFVEVPLPPVGEGWGEQVYLDDTLRIQVLERLGARVPRELVGGREEDEGGRRMRTRGFRGGHDSPQLLWPC